MLQILLTEQAVTDLRCQNSGKLLQRIAVLELLYGMNALENLLLRKIGFLTGWTGALHKPFLRNQALPFPSIQLAIGDASRLQ